MSFDTATRNRLANFVARCRRLLCGDFNSPGGDMAARLAHYGIQPSGQIAPLESLAHLDEPGLEMARLLRDLLAHKRARSPEAKVWSAFDGAVYDLLQEQGFTALNRLCALRMAEERKLIIQCVGKGQQSEGFELFEYHTDKTNENCPLEVRYQQFLYAFFDELALDLGALFARYSPQGLLFPSPQTLAALLAEINHPDLAPLWAEDETIGWIYQYWNSQEERRAMRDASAAPRNSRELAVRNQFFTPRYVVEFLTDNTLGRIWYEMRQGQSVLKEQCRYLVRRPNEIFLAPGKSAPETPVADNLSQEELLRQPVHIPHRPLKDPREIRLLDPACGSMHFGLYAFDLFEAIYAEAWDLADKSRAEGAAHTPEFSSFARLVAQFPSKAAFLREVPRLIIEHNLHGIDIDPRAAQIAGLSLWLRAQRTWHRQNVPASERPAIRRSNVVCAEPMPGEKELLREFVEQTFPLEERPIFQRLLEAVFEKMRLAGEAGSLLKIEEEILTAIAEARTRWKAGPRLTQGLLFGAPGSTAAQDELDLSGVTDELFWERVEDRIYAALGEYAAQAESTGYSRRLFAEDAAKGFAFIEVSRKRYDAVVMNPPYGLATPSSDTWVRQNYKDTCNDLYGSFSERAFALIAANRGYTGAITSKTFLYSKRLRDFRIQLSEGKHRLLFLIDFGLGVLDAMVETAAWIAGPKDSLQTTFWDWTNEDKASLSDRALELLFSPTSPPTLASLEQFHVLPFGVFSYWCPPEVLDAVSGLNAFEPQFGESVKGLTTFDDFRFIRLGWECDYTSKYSGDYRYIAKGGGWSRYHSETTMLIDWRKNGEIPRQNELKNYSTDARSKQSISFWFRLGLTYSEVSSLGFSSQPQQQGNLFGGSGFCIFPKDQFPMAVWLAFFNSRPVFSLMSMFSTDRHWNSEMVAKLPVPDLTKHFLKLATLGTRQFILARRDGELSETAAEFCVATLRSEATEREELCANQLEIDKIISTAYGFSEVSLGILTEKYPIPTHRSETAPDTPNSARLSYCLGLAFGRWDIRYATGERAAPELPDPFAPLPVCPPGMLQNAAGLPADREDVPADYPIQIPWDGILVDDPEHPLDIERRVRAVLGCIWTGQNGAPNAAAIEAEACELLEVRSLREYFRKPAGFFADHLKRYSKSRRKAPIYWPLSTPSGGYTIWLYYHRLNDGTLYKVVEQFVEPKQAEVQATFQTLAAKESRSRAEDRELENAQTLLGELAAFRDDLLRLAKIWKPNLNDGVVITAAPLWRHFRLPAWQKELRTTWESLERGEYDWAHLAYTLWPARVTEKCKTDRSLAIAHGLEHLCTIEPPKLKKKRTKAKVETEEQEGELL